MDQEADDSDRSTPVDNNDVNQSLLRPQSSSSQSRGTRQSDICAALPSKSLERACTIDAKHGSTLRYRKSQRLASRKSNVVVSGDTLKRVEGILPLDESFVDGSEADTWRKLDKIKAMSASMDVKRKTKNQLMAADSIKLTGYDKWKHEKSKQWKRTKRDFKEFMSNFELWRGSFKVIDGNFGPSVVAYFRFVKWLFWLNLFTSLLVLFSIILPQSIFAPDSFEDSLEIINNGTIMTKAQKESLQCSRDYQTYIMSRYEHLENDTVQLHVDMMLDLLEGRGWMEHTVLFMGFYFNKTYFFEEERYFFNMPLAYLLVPAVYLFISLILMVDHTSTGVKEKLVTQGDKFYRSCNKVFCGWDYSLSEEKAAALKRNNLYQEYINDLEEERRAIERANWSMNKKLWIYTIRTVIWLFTLAVWAGAIYLIMQVVGVWTPELLKRDSVQRSQWLTLIVEYLPSMSMTALYAVFPPIFNIIVQLENYEPIIAVNITIARSVMLRLLSIGVLVFTLTNLISDCDDAERICGVCDAIPSSCWETHVGQEFYKLVILDFIVVVGFTFFVEFPRMFIVRKFYEKNKLIRFVGYQEFIIPKNVLMIVYSQTICWLGAYFSPLIPLLNVVKFFIFFYCKKLSLLHCCVPASRQYRASRSNYFFMIILMISFALCLVFISYCIGRIPPSQGCGPFRVYTQESFYMHHVISDAVRNTPQVVQTILAFLWNWVAYFILLVIVCLLIYYYQALSSGNKRMVELLKEQLALEGKDKQFLLSRVNDALKRGDLNNVMNVSVEDLESVFDTTAEVTAVDTHL